MKFSDRNFSDKKFPEGSFAGAAEALRKNSLPAKLITVALIVIISIVFLDTMTESRDGRHSVISAEGSNEYIDSVKTDEEIRLQSILECISGVGKVHVMIQGSENADSGSSSVFTASLSGSYAKNSAGDTENKGGVIVVAEGGGDPNVCSRITDAVSTVCGIKPSEVVVFELRE